MLLTLYSISRNENIRDNENKNKETKIDTKFKT